MLAVITVPSTHLVEIVSMSTCCGMWIQFHFVQHFHSRFVLVALPIEYRFLVSMVKAFQCVMARADLDPFRLMYLASIFAYGGSRSAAPKLLATDCAPFSGCDCITVWTRDGPCTLWSASTKLGISYEITINTIVRVTWRWIFSRCFLAFIVTPVVASMIALIDFTSTLITNGRFNTGFSNLAERLIYRLWIKCLWILISFVLFWIWLPINNTTTKRVFCDSNFVTVSHFGEHRHELAMMMNSVNLMTAHHCVDVNNVSDWNFQAEFLFWIMKTKNNN